MSIRSTILAAAATLTLVGGVAAAGTLPARAATPSCGPSCVDVFSRVNSTFANTQFIMDATGQNTGAPVVTYPASGGYPGEDFTVTSGELVLDYYQAGIVSAGVGQNYGCDPGVDFPSCGPGQRDYDALELEFTPDGAPTGLCVGVASTAAQGTAVSLQPCGVSARTLWIVVPASLTGGFLSSFVVLVNGTDTDFTAPYVLTDAGPVGGLAFEQQLETANLLQTAGVPATDQLWAAKTGALPVSPLTVGTTSLPAATGGAAYSATLAAYGGATPYTWSVTAGSLPPGLTLNASAGVISGTPDVAGTYDFTVTVTDAENPAMTASAALSISVSGPVITSLRPASGPAYGDTPVVITGTGLSCPAGQAGCRVSVTFGGKPAVVELVQADEIFVVDPAGAGTVTVTVTVGGVSSQATSATNFTYQAII